MAKIMDHQGCTDRHFGVSNVARLLENVSEFHVKLLSGLAIVFYIHVVQGTLAQNLLWQLVVAYVGANHFVYGLHKLLGHSSQLSQENKDILIKLAGIGGMLKNNETPSWVWGFDEHRVSDVCVHLGMFLTFPWRIDHLAELVSHLGKYGGFYLELIHDHHDGSGLSVCDIVDVSAHCASAIYVLGLPYFLCAVVLAEGFRWSIHVSTINIRSLFTS